MAVAKTQFFEEEFEANVWNHSEDEFQVSFDTAPELSENMVQLLTRTLSSARDLRSGGLGAEEFDALLRELCIKNSEFVDRLVQILGLTRNKVIQDVKARAPAVGVTPRMSTLRSGVRDSATWSILSSYLRPRILRVADDLGSAGPLSNVLNVLNTVTWLGYIRQERAKRMGHEAERRAAAILHALGIPFEPEEKRTNPLCADATVAGISFDLVIPSTSNPKVVVKSTVHTANIGQYGESKDSLEVEAALTALIAQYGSDRPMLVAAVDGIGFRSNRAGLRAVLAASDQFFQFKTIWKLAALAAAETETDVAILLPKKTEQQHSAFVDQVSGQHVQFVATPPDEASPVIAGEAKIWRLGTQDQ